MKKNFNFHQISTIILFIILLINGKQVIRFFTGGDVYNSFGDAEVIIVLADTIYRWNGVVEGSFKVVEEACENPCVRKFAQAELLDGTRLLQYEITGYERIEVNWLDQEGGNIHY